MLTEREFKDIKEQLLKQIESFPPAQRESAKQKIEAMNAEELEQFLIQNNLIKKTDKCIFCLIAEGSIRSYKINENEEALAVLDINPISEGHTLAIPKEHKTIENSPKTLQLAHETSVILKKTLNPDEIKIESSTVQGHGVINIIPLYKNKKLERKKASEAGLRDLQEKITKKKEKLKKTEKERKIKIEELPKAPIRTP